MHNRPLDRRSLLGAGAIAALIAALPSSAALAAAPRFEVVRSPAEWRRRLGAARFAILRQAATEAPYSSPLNKEKRRGTFACAGCALPLYPSASKYDSRTGWPSFYAALPGAVRNRSDRSLGMERVEEICRRCGGHLGHLFDDGPPPTGKRHCINGLALTFRPT